MGLCKQKGNVHSGKAENKFHHSIQHSCFLLTAWSIFQFKSFLRIVSIVSKAWNGCEMFDWRMLAFYWSNQATYIEQIIWDGIKMNSPWKQHHPSCQIQCNSITKLLPLYLKAGSSLYMVHVSENRELTLQD